jgi:hypothetical protein
VKALSNAVGLQLHWVQPTIFARHFELYSENSLVGELRFETAATAYSTLTMAGSATESWTFKGAGFLKRRVTLRDSRAKDDLAVFWPNLRGEGWVEFFKGSKFHWKSTNFWRTEWGFFSVHEELLFVLKSKPSYPLQIQSVVEIGAQWHDLDELPTLLMLGWYLRVQNLYAGW